MDNIKEAVLRAEKRGISKALSAVENRASGYLELLDELYIQGKPSKVIGITGAPGVGKSSLINLYAEELLRRNKKVAVIAVDPSSPFTGGALLGDRIRMNSFSENLFIRSVATRGALGGISDAVFNMIVVFRAAGFDYILIETVGVGQNEIQVSKLSDIVLLLMCPGSGDDVQMMKAGIMETCDIVIIHKSDLAGADEIDSYVKDACFSKKILRTSVVKNTGIKELADEVDGMYINQQDMIEGRAKNILKEGLKTLLMHEVLRKVEGIVDSADIKLKEISEASTSPYKEMKRLMSKGLV